MSRDDTAGVSTRAESSSLVRSVEDLFALLCAELALPDCKLETVENILNENENIVSRIDETEGNTLLHVAVMNPFCNSQVIRLLTRRGVSISATNHRDKTALHLALENSDNHEVIDELIKRGAPVNYSDLDDMSPLQIAVKNTNCNILVLKTLLDAGCDVNETYMSTPLEYLLKNNSCNLDAVQFLFEKGAIITTNMYGQTMLQIYIKKGNCKVEIIKELVSRGEDILFKARSTQQNMIHLAMANVNCYNILPYLFDKLRQGINEKDNNSETPLHLLMKRNDDIDERVLRLLLENGADVDAKNYLGRRPLHYAVTQRKFRKKIVVMLLDSGSISTNGRTRSSTLGRVMDRYLERRQLYRQLVRLLIKYAMIRNFEDNLEWVDGFEEKTVLKKITKDIEYEEYPRRLVNYTTMCLQELIRMKKCLLINDLSLFDVIKSVKLPGIDEEVVDKILEAFHSYNYPIYRHCIVERTDRSLWLKKFKKLKICCKSNSIIVSEALVSNCMDKIGNYLRKDDLFKFCISLFKKVSSKSVTVKSKPHKRKSR